MYIRNIIFFRFFFDNHRYQTKVKLSSDIKNDWNYKMDLYHKLTEDNY